MANIEFGESGQGISFAGCSEALMYTMLVLGLILVLQGIFIFYLLVL